MLFDAFYQSDKLPHSFESGLGLGLAIVKAIAELHGGHVAAHSRGIGTGAAFTVTLPLGGAPPGEPSVGVTPADAVAAESVRAETYGKDH
jgi:signal transduction histidine kinase